MARVSEYDKAAEAAAYIQSVLRSELGSSASEVIRPEVLIICGSGLGKLSETLSASHPKYEIPYKSVPHLRTSTVPGHAAKLVFGVISGSRDVPVVCMVGRLHSYEGYELTETVLPVRTARLLGASTLIATNAAGSLNTDFQVGDFMLLNDHINMPGLAGMNVLRGPNEDKFGPRFPGVSDAYSFELRQLFSHKFNDLRSKDAKQDRLLHEGTYVYVCGPNYETRAECRYLSSIGGDAVGMSTVAEVIAARHCGMSCLALSLITNKALFAKPLTVAEHEAKLARGERIPALNEGMATHEEVLEAANSAADFLQEVVIAVVGDMKEDEKEEKEGEKDGDEWEEIRNRKRRIGKN